MTSTSALIALVRDGRGQAVRVGSGRAEVDGGGARRPHPLPQPRAILGTGRPHGVHRVGGAVEIDRLPRASDGDDLDVLPREQTHHLAAQGRVTEHDRALDPPAELGLAQQSAVGVDHGASEARPADDLGDERETAPVGQLLRGGAGIRSRDDDRSRSRLQHVRRLGLGREVGDADSPAALVMRARGVALVGCGVVRGCGTRGAVDEPLRGGPGEGLAQRDVEVHRSRGPGALPQRRGQRRRSGLIEDGGLAAPGIRIHVLGHGKVGLVARRRAEEPGLARGLVRSDPAQLGRAIGGEEDERHTRVMRLQHGGQEVGHGRPGRAYDGGRNTGLTPDAQRGEARDAFVDADVQPHDPRPLQVGGDERERLRAGPGADDQVPDSARDETGQERGGRVGRRGRGAPFLSCHGQPTAPR
jgi:hypothetical protein